ncbi:MAG: hypothetical protein AAF532_12625 [Planctomycetota bacterium]
MRIVEADGDTLGRMFAGAVEQTFQTELGVADPPLTDYLATLLMRFVRSEAVFQLRDPHGRPLEEVTAMALEAAERTARPRRDAYRHIGDFTLFWTGLYPDALKKLRGKDRADALLDYADEGRKSYLRAADCPVAKAPDEEAPVLRRLGEQFEMCCYGLGIVKQVWGDPPLAGEAA